MRRAGHGKTSFRARFSCVKGSNSQVSYLTWKTTLLNLGGSHTWWLCADSCTRVDTPEFNALIRLARRLTKKRGYMQVYTYKGQPTTAKSLGTRMGNGKGKVINHRQWWSSGFKFLKIISRTRPRWLSALSPRCGASLKISATNY